MASLIDKQLASIPMGLIFLSSLSICSVYSQFSVPGISWTQQNSHTIFFSESSLYAVNISLIIINMLLALQFKLFVLFIPSLPLAFISNWLPTSGNSLFKKCIFVYNLLHPRYWEKNELNMSNFFVWYKIHVCWFCLTKITSKFATLGSASIN